MRKYQKLLLCVWIISITTIVGYYTFTTYRHDFKSEVLLYQDLPKYAIYGTTRLTLEKTYYLNKLLWFQWVSDVSYKVPTGNSNYNFNGNYWEPIYIETTNLEDAVRYYAGIVESCRRTSG